jgi:hypothetical protein
MSPNVSEMPVSPESLLQAIAIRQTGAAQPKREPDRAYLLRLPVSW